MKVGTTKIQPNGSDKKGNQKKRSILKYNYTSGKMKLKMLSCFTEMQSNGPDKKQSRKSGCHSNMLSQ